MDISSENYRQSVTCSFVQTASDSRWRLVAWPVAVGVVLRECNVFSVLFVCSVVWLTFPTARVVAESVLAVRDVGLQLTVSLSDGSQRHAFVARPEVQDVLINEAPAGFTIRTYLVVIGKSGKNYIPFEHTQLSIRTSAQVLFAIRQVLFDESTS